MTLSLLYNPTLPPLIPNPIGNEISIYEGFDRDIRLDAWDKEINSRVLLSQNVKENVTTPITPVKQKIKPKVIRAKRRSRAMSR